MLLGVPVMAVNYALFAQFVGKRLCKKGISASELAQHEHVMEQRSNKDRKRMNDRACRRNLGSGHINMV